MSNQGWIKIHRGIQDSDIWNLEESFCRRAAWIDLLTMANYKNGNAFNKIPVSRGELISSINKLSLKWHWHHRKTKSFLDLLALNDMIVVEYKRMYVFIRIVNYDKYQLSTDIPTSVLSNVPSSVPTSVPQYKKDKNSIKKDKNKEAVAFDNDEDGERE